MKITQRISNLLGIGVLRNQPAPDHQLIAEGLMITDREAIAWYELGTENTQLASEAHNDALLDEIIASAPPILEGHACHLKIVWSSIDGTQYLTELGDRAKPWDQKRARYLDEFEISERRVLLGIVVDHDRQGDGSVIARRAARHALGLPPGRIAEKELRYVHARVRELAKALNNTSWKVKLAGVETLAWLIAREQHRGTTALPAAGTLTGAGLGRLTQGRLVPYSDHLEAIGEAGQVTKYVAVMVISGFPEQIQVPGSQEWLRTLSTIERAGVEGENVAVNAEASVRFTILTDAAARKRVKDAHDLAKEQRQSAAKHSTGETSQEIEETELAMAETLTQISRNNLRLVEAHPRLIVSEDTIEDLQGSIDAVRSHYQKLGFEVHLAVDEQRELWLESLPGDQLRVTDLGHTLEAVAFFGGWWWGGAAVGQSPGTRMVGHLTGSTPGIVRSDVASGTRRGDATVSAYVGRAGRGKTTAIMLDALNVVADQNTWVGYLSLKGDDLGISEVARTECGVDSRIISIGTRDAGAADLFRALSVDDAKVPVASQLTLLAPGPLRHLAEVVLPQVIEDHVNRVAQPSTWGVICDLMAYSVEHDSGDVEARRRMRDVRDLGRTYAAYASTPLGAPLLAEWSGTEALPTRPGLWVVHFPALKLPSSDVPMDQWDELQRLSVALLRAFILHTVAIAGAPALRGMPKLVSVPEVHLLLNTRDGMQFLDQVARMGRAQNASLQIDLQDLTSIMPHQGLIEQITTLCVFQLTSPAEQDAAAVLCGMEAGPDSRAVFQELARDNTSDKPRKGHCVMRDVSGRAGLVQYTFPDQYVADMLNTTPEANKHVDDADVADHQEAIA